MKSGPNIKKKPLYILAQEKALGECQYMDIETLEWIKKVSGYKEDEKINVPVKLNEKDFDTIEKFIPPTDLFFRKEHISTIHGISHISRVIVFSKLICKLIEVSDCTPALISSKIHDLLRYDDRGDAGHGKRAWEELIFNKEKYLKPHEDVLNDSVIAEKIRIAVVYHEVEYEKINELSMDNRQVLDILKGADALDRFRMPKAKWFINPEFVYLKDILVLIPASKKFTIESEERILDGEDPVLAVLNTARRIFKDD